MQSLVEYSHLHEWVKQKTADLRLPADITEAPPFSDLPRLASHVKERLHHNPFFPGCPEKQPWLNRLGAELCRVELDHEADTARIRAFAADLAETVWRTTPALEIIPYIDGEPAGTPKRAEVVWLDRVLFVEELPKAKLARLVPDRLGKVFARPEVTAALNYCFGRSAEDVTEYIEENFKLVPRSTAAPLVGDTEAPEAQTAPATNPPQLVDGGPLEKKSNETRNAEPNVASEPTEDEAAPTAEADAAQGELDGVDPGPPKDPPHPKPTKPSIIERFARSQGFQKDGEDRFFHADGSWIAKANGDRFPWERRTAKGDLVRHYWPKDHCLEREPLQLEADIWGLIDKFPETYALVLSDSQGDPVEVPGARLRAMRDGGELTLYPATYRLVLDHDRKQ